MQNQLFPSEIIDNSVEIHLHKNSTKSQIIYILIVLSIISAIISLPFIKVTITVQGRGIIRPITEKSEVTSLVSGIVTKITVKENQKVKIGDNLLSIKKDNLTNKINLNEYQQNNLENKIYDLEQLVKLKAKQFKSPVYYKEYIQFKNKIDENKNKQRKAKKELEKNKILFDEELICEKNYDEFKYNLSLLKNQYNLIVSNQLNKWQADLMQYKSNQLIINCKLS